MLRYQAYHHGNPLERPLQYWSGSINACRRSVSGVRVSSGSAAERPLPRGDAAHKRPCKMPAGARGHLIPPGPDWAFEPLDLRLPGPGPADPALVALRGPGARHPLCTGRADRGADADRIGEAGDPDLLEVETLSLVTPGRDNLIARDEGSHDIPEPFCRLVGHTADLVIAISEEERDVAAGPGDGGS